MLQDTEIIGGYAEFLGKVFDIEFCGLPDPSDAAADSQGIAVQCNRHVLSPLYIFSFYVYVYFCACIVEGTYPNFIFSLTLLYHKLSVLQTLFSDILCTLLTKRHENDIINYKI